MTTPRSRKRLRNFLFIALVFGTALLLPACDSFQSRGPGVSKSSISRSQVSGTQDRGNRPEKTEPSATSAETAPLPSAEKKGNRPFPGAPGAFPDTEPAPVAERSRTPQPTLERVTNPESDSVGEPSASIEQTEAGSEASPPGREAIRTALFSGSGKNGGKTEGMPPVAETEKSGPPPAAPGPMLLNTFPYHYGNAQKLMEIGESERALSEFRKALELSPGHLECRLAYGECLEKTGNRAQALAEYEGAAAQYPQEPRPCLKIGNLHLTNGKEEDLEKARAAYQKALEIKPDYLYALYNLGLLEKTTGHPQRAIAFFKKVLLANGDYAAAHLNLGLLLQTEKENVPEAIKHFKRYLELDGEHAEAVRSILDVLNKDLQSSKQKGAQDKNTSTKETHAP